MKLKPCPFCGSERIVKGERYFAMCVDCGATGPEKSKTKWVADWNSRCPEGPPLTPSVPLTMCGHLHAKLPGE